MINYHIADGESTACLGPVSKITTEAEFDSGIPGFQFSLLATVLQLLSRRAQP